MHLNIKWLNSHQPDFIRSSTFGRTNSRTIWPGACSICSIGEYKHSLNHIKPICPKLMYEYRIVFQSLKLEKDWDRSDDKSLVESLSDYRHAHESVSLYSLSILILSFFKKKKYITSNQLEEIIFVKSNAQHSPHQIIFELHVYFAH